MFQKLALGVALALFWLYSIIGGKLFFSWLVERGGDLGMALLPLIAVLWIGIILFATYKYFKSFQSKIQNEKPV